jgi:hypothetical protein
VTNQSTTDEGVMPVATVPDHKTKFREEADVGQALLDTADAIADMARRVQLNGPEPRRGHQHGRWLKEDAR